MMGVASAGRGTKTNGRMLSALVKPPCEWMLGLRLLDSKRPKVRNPRGSIMGY